MRGFVQRALTKIKKLDPDQLEGFIQALASENEELERVLDSMQEGILSMNQAHEVLFYNKALERLVPLAAGEPLEKLIWEAIADPDIAGFVRSTLGFQDSVKDREFTLEGPGGDRIVSISILPNVQQGKIQGTILLVRDVSEKRQREAQLRRAESLASLTTLAAGVAHEIKNPLGSIGIHIQLIERVLRQKSCSYPIEVAEYLKVMNEEVERLNRIVVDFLFAVRPIDLHPMVGSLNEVVHELIQFMHFEIEQAKIRIEEKLDPCLPDVSIDERFVKQALLNIVKNAISAMPNGGTLTIKTLQRGNDVILRISDTGVGMSRAVQAKIFEPFFTTKDFGSGIGLTLVYKIMKEHGGDISVFSQEGKGSAFSLSFPVPQNQRALLSWDKRGVESREQGA